MIKHLLLSFALLLLNPIFSQTTPGESIDLASIIGFEVADVTDANLASLGMQPTTGARGVKLIHMGPKIKKIGSLGSMNTVGIEGDILISIRVQNKWGKLYENRAIWDLKDFCNILIQYKEKGGEIIIYASAPKTHNDKNRMYQIDINGINPVFLTQYVLGINKSTKIVEPAKAIVVAKGSNENPNETQISNLQSIIGFEVAEVTNDNLASLGISASNGAKGIKLVHLGPKIKKLNTFGSNNTLGVEGDILTKIQIQTKWKVFESRSIWDLKDFCKLLIQYKEKGGEIIIFASTAKIKNEKQRTYQIDINGLNSTLLTQYVLSLDQPQKVVEKTKNDIATKNTKRNSEEEEESKDIYASSVDFDKPGKFYAIIIGASNYTDPGIPDLDSLPIKDAMALKKVLSQKYIFDKENIKALYNPTRRDIVIAFAEMSKKITPEDNLLIFYAGHGHYEKESDIGYWLPVDAEVGNPSNWLYNDQLVADVKKIKSLHTLLISDACFSGSIFKTRSVNMQEASSFIKQKYSLPSRKAITSGTLKTVPNKSVFLKYLIDRLTNNKEAFFTASQLFQSLEQPVSNNSKSLPQFGVIQNVGDEGGDFIFIKR